MSLFDKYAPLKNRVDVMMKLGKDALGVQFDDIIDATRGRIGNREILLAGTNNYLGLTFDDDCVAAAKDAVWRNIWVCQAVLFSPRAIRRICQLFLGLRAIKM